METARKGSPTQTSSNPSKGKIGSESAGGAHVDGTAIGKTSSGSNSNFALQ